MQRQTRIRHRWTATSAAILIMMLGSSGGCESLSHYASHHGGFGRAAEQHERSYFHCPHCGQIIPKDGFNQCQTCLRIHAYHGYEPTCWRQWPEGWGCSPEAVIDYSNVLEPGMLEDNGEPHLTGQLETALPPQPDELPRPTQ